jgi:hypothetical protein
MVVWVKRAGMLVFALLSASGCVPETHEFGTLDPETRNESATLRVVVLVSLDTLRADHLSTYGYERFTSPAAGPSGYLT